MTAPGSVRKGEATRDSWETPGDVFAALDREFHFGVDAAADFDNCKVVPFLTGPCVKPLRCECGLCAEWVVEGANAFPLTTGVAAFLNPPFGLGLDAWVAKCAAESAKGCTVVATLPNSTEAGWFRAAKDTADEVRFVYPRIQYIHDPAKCTCKACKAGKKGSNTGGTAIFVWWPFSNLRPHPARVFWWTWEKAAKAPVEQPGEGVQGVLV